MKKSLMTLKNKISGSSYLIVLMSLWFGNPVMAQPLEFCTEDMYSLVNLMKLQKPGDSTIAPLAAPPNSHYFETYEGCPANPNNLRTVAFVHGLGGSRGAWDKQITFTMTQYPAASFGADYGGFERSMDDMGGELNTDLAAGFGQVNQYYFGQYGIERCIKDDYVIAHSQGGIAARYIDWAWNTNYSNGSFGLRKFNGLVTFGTSHAGADIALTKEEHYGYVSDVISTVILYALNEKMYDLTNNFPGTFLASGVYNLKEKFDTLIKNELAPLMLAKMHTPTLDAMAPGSSTMNTLNNHWGSLHRVAFYGIEEAPECWRVMDMVITKGAEEYPLWGAEPDEEFMIKMELVRALHTTMIEKNEGLIFKKEAARALSFALLAPILNSEIVALKVENERRNDALVFLNNANTEWRYLIGSYHRDSLEPIVEAYFVVNYQVNIALRHSVYQMQINKSKTFDRLEDAEDFAEEVNGQVTQKFRVRLVQKFYPSDGVVLARSQRAYPGVKEDDVDIMPGDNHFQERNSKQTERVLKTLYEGTQYDKYFKIKP